MKSTPSSSPFYALVDRLTDLYVSYRGRYIEARNNNGRPSIYIPHRGHEVKRLDNEALINHMRRRVAVGVFAGTKSSKFITFDIDLPDPEIVRKVMAGIEAVGFRHEDIHVSSSGGKGYHVEIFFSDLMFTDDLRSLYNQVVAAEHLDTRKVEFRPTHAQAIKLPLSKHHKTGNICWFLDRDTLEPIESEDYIMGIVPVNRDHAVELIRSRCRPADMRKERPAQAANIERSESGTDLPVLTAPGMRNRTMTSIAIRLRYEGKSEEEIRQNLARWVKEQNPEFITDPPKVVGDDVDGLAHWVWSPDFRMGVTREVRLTADEFAAVLNCGKGTMRRTLFLLLLFSKKYGEARMTAERIGKYVGCSKVTVHSCVRRLAEQGLVSVYAGAHFHAAEHMVSHPNSYEVHLPAAGSIGEPFVTSGISETLAASWDWTPETFQFVWRSAIEAFVPAARRGDYFTDKELAAAA